MTLKRATQVALIAACCQFVWSIFGLVGMYSIYKDIGPVLLQSLSLVFALGPIVFYWTLYHNQKQKG